MKRLFWMVLALSMSVVTTDVSAQSFLKKLGKTVNDVSREVNKHVNKGTKNTSGTSKQQQKKPQTQEAASSNQSFEEQNEDESLLRVNDLKLFSLDNALRFGNSFVLSQHILKF